MLEGLALNNRATFSSSAPSVQNGSSSSQQLTAQRRLPARLSKPAGPRCSSEICCWSPVTKPHALRSTVTSLILWLCRSSIRLFCQSVGAVYLCEVQTGWHQGYWEAMHRLRQQVQVPSYSCCTRFPQGAPKQQQQA